MDLLHRALAAEGDLNEAARRAVLADPCVRAALDVFGAEVAEVRVRVGGLTQGQLRAVEGVRRVNVGIPDMPLCGECKREVIEQSGYDEDSFMRVGKGGA